ncbi:MAG: replication initiator [Egibacteraceae bacterium]
MRTDRWAHQLGYGGHFLTKPRHYSTTFTKLRNARRGRGGPHGNES